MDFVNTDLKTMAYISSDAEFNRARMNGFWEQLLYRILQRRTCLLAYRNSGATLAAQTTDLGLQDIALENIVGSLDRSQDFTRHFWPSNGNKQGKERWRTIYTQVVTGTGLPPIALYKVGSDYYVKDGHHRVSVARYVGWPTIQAYVTEVNTLPVAPAVSCCRLELPAQIS